jgi:hypothetical protein
MKDHEIRINLSEADFEQSIKRKSKDQAEFDKWANLVEKGLLNGHINWDILYECVSEAITGSGRNEPC